MFKDRHSKSLSRRRLRSGCLRYVYRWSGVLLRTGVLVLMICLLPACQNFVGGRRCFGYLRGSSASALESRYKGVVARRAEKEDDIGEEILFQLRSMLGSDEGVLQQEIAGITSSMDELDARFEESRARLQEAEDSESEMTVKLSQALRQETVMEKALVDVRSEYEVATDELELIQVSELRLKAEIQRFIDREAELTDDIVATEDEIADLSKVREEKESLQEELESAKAQEAEVAARVAEVDARESQLKEELEKATKMLNLLTKQISQARENEAAFRSRMEEANARSESLERDLGHLERTADSLSVQLKSTLLSIDASQNAQEKLNDDLDAQTEKAIRLARELVEARQEEEVLIRTMEETTTSLQADLEAATDQSVSVWEEEGKNPEEIELAKEQLEKVIGDRQRFAVLQIELKRARKSEAAMIRKIQDIESSSVKISEAEEDISELVSDLKAAEAEEAKLKLKLEQAKEQNVA